ncbi:siderophore-iron reductase FhuF [Kushneria sp. AK178]
MFDALFNERLERFGAVLTCRRAGMEGVMPVRRLLEQDMLDSVLTRFSHHHGPCERRAVATQWSKHYLSQLIIPITVIELCRDVHLPTSLDDMGVVLGADGTPERFVLPHEGTISLDNGCVRFCPLIAHHLTPLIDALARRVHFSPRVLWSNAAVYFEFAVNELERQGLASAFEINGARAMMAQRQLPDRQRNPFYRPVEYIDVVDDSGTAEPWRCRRMCCLRYLDDSLELCGNCPRLKTTRASEQPAQA